MNIYSVTYRRNSRRETLTTVKAHNPKEARDRFRKDNPDVVITGLRFIGIVRRCKHGTV